MPTTTTTANVASSTMMLLFFSFLILLEGTSRMTTYSKPGWYDTDYQATNNNTELPIAAYLAGGIAETLLGLFGCVLAILVGVFRHDVPLVASWAFTYGVQPLLSLFVVIIFALYGPSLAARHDDTGIPGVLSMKEHKVLWVFGHLLGSMTFAIALLGGQFVMAQRFLQDQQEQDVRVATTPSGMRWSALGWTINFMAAAGSTMYVGILLVDKDFESEDTPILALPHVVWYPEVTVTTAVVMILYGVSAILAVVYDKAVLVRRWLSSLWAITTLMMLVNFSWMYGMIPGPLVPLNALSNVGPVFALTLLPVIHVWTLHGDGDQGQQPGEHYFVKPSVMEQARPIGMMHSTSSEPMDDTEEAAV